MKVERRLASNHDDAAFASLVRRAQVALLSGAVECHEWGSGQY